MDDLGVWLERGPDRDAAIEAIATETGGRVGLAGVLADLNREARPVTRRHAAWAFAWDDQDQRSDRWWPQGITSSADAEDSGEAGGHPVLITSSYAMRMPDEVHRGARISVIDLADRDKPRYRHVLLVAPEVDDTGHVTLKPVPTHAGGIAWRGHQLHVAGTRKGVQIFCLDDILRVRTDRPGTFGYRYVLPLHTDHQARTAEGTTPFRYSFLSVSRDGGRPRLLAGEYNVSGLPTRLAAYDLDPATGLLATDADGTARPTWSAEGPERMQGALLVDGRLTCSTSRGRFRGGSIWSGTPGALVEHRGVLPAGPEDLAHWTPDDQLLTLTEYPRRRVVLALSLNHIGAQLPDVIVRRTER